MSYSNEILREIILDHVKNPRNKDKNHDGYLEYTLKNPSCGDIVTVYIKYNENKIIDITYKIEGCSICNSSTSIMSELLLNKSLEEAETIIENFNKMIVGENFNESLLDDAIALIGIKDVPTRIKCATLPYKALLNAIKEEDNGL